MHRLGGIEASVARCPCSDVFVMQLRPSIYAESHNSPKFERSDLILRYSFASFSSPLSDVVLPRAQPPPKTLSNFGKLVMSQSHSIIWRVVAGVIADAAPQRPPKTYHPASHFSRRSLPRKRIGRSRPIINHQRAAKCVNRAC